MFKTIWSLFGILLVLGTIILISNSFHQSLVGLLKFSTDLYSESAGVSNENIVISPYSVASALALLSQGAKGKTFDQIANGLYLPRYKGYISVFFSVLISEFEETTKSVTLNVANKIYVKQGYHIKDNFKQVAVMEFHSDINKINFADKTMAANTINRWVKSRTNDKIKNLISSDSLNEDTRLVLVNAIYFKGKWKHGFNEKNNMLSDFFINENDKVKTNFMITKQSFNFGELSDLDATAIELPYKDSDAAFTIILPNKRNGLSLLESKIKNYDFTNLKLHETQIEIHIPKFKIEYQIKLNEVLKKLGIKNIFGSNADLGDLLDEKVKVSEVIHKAFIEVNEEGAEAAASTAVFAQTRSGNLNRRFVADHPFLFFISQSNIILFAGRVKKF